MLNREARQVSPSVEARTTSASKVSLNHVTWHSSRERSATLASATIHFG